MVEKDNSLKLGDVIEVTERHKVIGFDGPDTMTLNLGDETVDWWLNDRLVDRDDLDARVVDGNCQLETVTQTLEIESNEDLQKMYVSLDDAVLDMLEPKKEPCEVTITIEVSKL